MLIQRARVWAIGGRCCHAGGMAVHVEEGRGVRETASVVELLTGKPPGYAVTDGRASSTTSPEMTTVRGRSPQPDIETSLWEKF